jgi:hypothetical protein
MRDVVEFEVEKDAVALLDEPAHERWPFGGEQGTADLEAAYGAAKASRELDGRNRVVDVESN